MTVKPANRKVKKIRKRDTKQYIPQKVLDRALLRIKEYLARRSKEGKRIVWIKKPYFLGVTYVRCEFKLDGDHYRMYFRPKDDRWVKVA